MGKDFKIWGFGYGLLGDIIAALPLLDYYEKKHPDSYKIFVVEKKCSQIVDLLINHPLIDRIKVTDHWDNVGENDREIAASCDIRDASWKNINKPRKGRWKGRWHKPSDWYNYYTFGEETARMFGIDDFNEVLTKEEQYPKLNQWFDIGFDLTRDYGGYNSGKYQPNSQIPKNIAIWPFAGYGNTFGRSPSVEWWKECVKTLCDLGYTVHHFGIDKHVLSESQKYTKYTHLSFFDQIKLSLASEIVIGCESGPMWIHGAYSHSAIHLMTNYLKGHNKNLLGLNPLNRNSEVFFDGSSCDNIKQNDIIESIERRIILK